MVYSDAVPRFVKAWNALGIHTNANPVRGRHLSCRSQLLKCPQFGGDACGIYNTCRSVDYESGKRITSTAAYYTPAASRPNLKLLTGAHVCPFQTA
jgi:choline dehydrogenase-like flavoprotein